MTVETVVANIDTAANETTARIDVLARLAEVFPNYTTEELTALADWATTGTVAVDPAGLDRAARRLAQLSGGAVPTASERGTATAVVLAYLGH